MRIALHDSDKINPKHLEMNDGTDSTTGSTAPSGLDGR